MRRVSAEKRVKLRDLTPDPADKAIQDIQKSALTQCSIIDDEECDCVVYNYDEAQGKFFKQHSGYAPSSAPIQIISSLENGIVVFSVLEGDVCGDGRLKQAALHTVKLLSAYENYKAPAFQCSLGSGCLRASGLTALEWKEDRVQNILRELHIAKSEINLSLDTSLLKISDFCEESPPNEPELSVESIVALMFPQLQQFK